MLGYVYVMSNEAMPGLYKIGCTARHPYERASDLNNTSVPSPFIVEYCINIDDYANVEKLIHKELSAYNFGKEFFQCDLEKCILSVKKIADSQSGYSEAYRDQQIKAKIEMDESQYLQVMNESQSTIPNIKCYTAADALKDTYNNKYDVFGDTNKQLYYYTTNNKQYNDKEREEYERKEKERKARSERLIREREERLRKAREIQYKFYCENRSFSELNTASVINNRIEQYEQRQEQELENIRETLRKVHAAAEDGMQEYLQRDPQKLREEYEQRERERKVREAQVHQNIADRMASERKKYSRSTQLRVGAEVGVSKERIGQIDRERKEQRAREMQRHKDWSNNKTVYAANSKQEVETSREQDTSDVGSEIFTIFFVLVIIPLILYLLMQ